MLRWRRKLVEFVRSEDGPTTTEYAVMLAVIAVAALVSMAGFGASMEALYTTITAGVDVF